MTITFIGIDPGAQGGIAVIRPNGDVFLYPMPKNAQGVWDMAISSLMWGPRQVWMEKVSGYIGNAHPGSRMFEFGRNYGRLEMAILGATGQLPNDVLPQDWQSYLGIEPRRKSSRKGAGETKPQFKRRMREFACGIFPGVKVTPAVADALLIAHYGRKIYGK